MKKKSTRKTCKKFKPFQGHGKTSINDLAENIEKPKVVSRETKIRNFQFNLLKKIISQENAFQILKDWLVAMFLL